MKSILIVNNTKGRCKSCPLLEVLDYNEEECKCYMTGFDVTDVVAEDKYVFSCPLKSLPQKKEIQYPTTDGITTVIGSEYTLNDYLFDKGYNDCIDEILGGK